ncbi:MAG: hypothetical protein KGJ36_01970, partial [Acidobacteriota bacterium]|nr:hypothetical protein [Acidobacteriota bacterium]
RSQDGPNALAVLMSNRGSGPAVWRYVTGRWDDALARFPEYLYPRLTWGLPTYITDAALADEVEEFHLSHPLERQRLKVAQSIELMRVGLAFTTAIRAQF